MYIGRDLVAQAYARLLRPASTYGYRERTSPESQALTELGSDITKICLAPPGSDKWFCDDSFIKRRLTDPKMERDEALAALRVAGQRRECVYISFVDLRDPNRKPQPLGIGATSTRCFNEAKAEPDSLPYCPAPGSTNGSIDAKSGLVTTIIYSPNQTRRIWNGVCRNNFKEVGTTFAQSVCDLAPPGTPKKIKWLLKRTKLFCNALDVWDTLEKAGLYYMVGTQTERGGCLMQQIALKTARVFSGSSDKKELAVCARLRKQDAADTPPPPSETPVPSAVAGPWQPGGPVAPSTASCGKPITVEAAASNPAQAAANGSASVRVCLVWYRSVNGTYYYQGALQVSYAESSPGSSDLFAGKSMSARGSTGKATGIRDCPSFSWSRGTVLWCFSPTVPFTGAGERLYAKGYLLDRAGGWHPVWSPSITTVGAQPAGPTPPNIPSRAAAQSELNTLTVSSERSMTGYSRSLFPHWITISGKCDTRKTVLERDGSAVTVDANCSPTSGSWYSQYDGVILSSASGVEVDHVIPLAEAWRSGANSWSRSRRQSFANDLAGPQLIAVSVSSNRSKGDRDPSIWKPIRTAYHCTYSKMWIRSKRRWGLRLQSTEKSALQGMLNTCPS